MKRILLLGLLLLSACNNSNGGRGKLLETYYDVYCYQEYGIPYRYVVSTNIVWNDSLMQYEQMDKYYVDIDYVHCVKKTSLELPNNAFYIYTHEYLLIIYI